MRFLVNERCMGCRYCLQICPAVFSLTEFGTAEVIVTEASGETLTRAWSALDHCPTFAIEAMA